MSGHSSVLVVSGDPQFRQGIELLLEGRDYRVRYAATGREGLLLAGRIPFDLHLLDLDQPDTVGLHLVEEVLQTRPSAQIVIAAGRDSYALATAALESGASDFLKKPFFREELEKTLRNARLHKQLADTNRDMHLRLRQTERRCLHWVQNSPDMVYVLDTDGRFTFVNKAAETRFGYDSRLLIGRAYSELFDRPDDISRARWHFNERRTGLRATSGLELRIKTGPKRKPGGSGANGHAMVELNATGIYRSAGNLDRRVLVGTYGVVRDVSDRKRMEAQLLQAKKMQAVGNLAGGIAHDFNNLLMGIQGNVSLMLMGLVPGDPLYERVKSIEQHVQDGAALTRQLLGFVRSRQFEIRTVSINSLILKQNRLFGRTHREIRLMETFSQDLWPVDVDPVQIEQVLLNLYVNAWHAMPEGGTLGIRTRNVRLAARDRSGRRSGLPPGRYVRISVTDTGTGMDERTLRRIFEPFFTTKRMGKGSGLGLAFAREIIRNHGGDIRAYSKPGKGTTFVLHLPASDNPEGEARETVFSAKVGRECILLVDDEPRILQTCGANLALLGYRVVTAEGGRQAIDRYRTADPPVDLVVLDMVMPDLNGRETYEGLKAIDPGVKVLLASGYSMEGQAEAILEKGCNGFIQKPFTIEQLSTAIRHVLDCTSPKRLPAGVS